eukprot:TRINITY_DN18245_c0_g1_i1.p1 TRINITY_DN18245_c0_g1~~TRINITY_DN18245_c0_g1_i1.p1  ORF type:complete len:542 (+),score=70.61 TRINITY_DN18245_c0_g1_i1:25-1626(+)
MSISDELFKEFLKSPEAQAAIQQEQEDALKEAERATKKLLYKAICACEDVRMKELLTEIWLHPPVQSVLMSLYRDTSPEYGSTFEERLRHPRVHQLLAKYAEQYRAKKLDKDQLTDQYAHLACSLGEKQEQKSRKPKLDAQSLLPLMQAAQEAKDTGNKAFKKKDFKSAFDWYNKGVAVLSQGEPFRHDEKLYYDVFCALNNNLAAAGLHVGEYRRAISATEQVLKRLPQDVKALFRRASALAKLGETDRSRVDLRAVLELDPTNSDALALMKKLDEQESSSKQVFAKMFSAKPESINSPAEVQRPEKSEPLGIATEPAVAVELLAGQPRAIVFNLYGTLLQISVRLTPSPLLRFIERIGPTVFPDVRRAVDAVMRRNFESVTELCLALHRDARAALVKDTEAKIHQEIESVKLLPKTTEGLRALRAAGFRLVLVANAVSMYAEPVRSLGLYELFDSVLLSCQTRLCKPDREVYELTIQKCGCLPSDILWCGDHPQHDVAVPKSFGMRSLHFVATDARPSGPANVCSELGIEL